MPKSAELNLELRRVRGWSRRSAPGARVALAPAGSNKKRRVDAAQESVSLAFRKRNV